MDSLTKDKYISGSINTKFKAKVGGSLSGIVHDLQLQNVTSGGEEDFFYALGFFSAKLSGCYEVEGNDIKFIGTIGVDEKYDWQNPGAKDVIILGDVIKDSYATLVEDHKLALMFYVNGMRSIDTTFVNTGGSGGR